MRIVAAVALSILAASVLANDVDAPRVTIDSGIIEGVSENGLDVFRGIPYAKPPIGDLRWRAPQPVAAWPGIRYTKSFGAICPQTRRSQRLEAEDCLTINVWAPPAADNAPVMLWIHGGANVVGSGIINGAPFARDGVVLATLNYRLGLFGVFSHPELTRRANELGEPTGNFGVMDQIAALEWIQRNISAFGGDPNRVTIFGVSAGGTHVNNLMASPRAKGLFHGAIAQSGANGLTASRSLAQVERAGTAFANGRGAGSLDGLYATPWRDLYADLTGLTGFGTFIDGRILVDHVGETFRKGLQNDVPYIGGANSHEGSLAATIPIPAFRQTLERNRQAVAEAYGKAGDDPSLPLLVYGDGLFVAPTRYLVANMAEVSSPAYTYHMDYVLSAFVGKTPGTPHGGEVAYVFDNLRDINLGARMARNLGLDPGTYKPAKADLEMAATMHRYWVRFATTGDPNGRGLPAWPRYTRDDPLTMVFANTGVAPQRDLRKAPLDLVERLSLRRLAAMRR